MNRRFVSLSSALVILTSAAPLWANPIAVEILRVRQVPLTHHVQITYAVDQSYGVQAEPETPSELTRDGEVLARQWTLAAGSFSANTGSGIAPTKAVQTCDCDLPAGQYEYAATVMSPSGSEVTLSASLTVIESLPLVADAGAPAGDLSPWDIPEPGEIQGLDCVAQCGAVQPEPDSAGGTNDLGGLNSDAGSGQADSSGINPTKDDDDGGCSVANPREAFSALAGVLLLLGFGLLRRRRSV